MKHVLFVLALSTSTAAFADPVKVVPAQLDPAQAYVLVEAQNADIPKQGSGFIIARYDSARGDLAGAPVTTTTRDGDRITEITTKSDVERETIGTKPLVKDKLRRLFLVAVRPGLWTVEGAASLEPPFGSQVTSFSLGSPTLTLAAGTITDLGVAEVGGDWKEGEKPKTTISVGDVFAMGMLGKMRPKQDPVPAKIMFRSRGSSDLPLPTSLSKLSIRPVEWGPSVEFGNYLGGLVNRLGGRALRAQAPANN